MSSDKKHRVGSEFKAGRVAGSSGMARRCHQRMPDHIVKDMRWLIEGQSNVGVNFGVAMLSCGRPG
jgi:hypothetical protein